MIAEIVSNHKLRIVENNGNFYKIHPEDVRMVNKKKETRSQETIKKMQESAIAKLDSLIGLNQLKKEIKTWSNYIKVEKKREEMNLSSNKISLHMTFKGSPGTGKTTVARIMGDILQSNGLLSRGHFKEVTRSDLVAEYMGQTSIKVKKLMKEMEGGVLFIDEAYSLVQGENDVYGKEAVDTLIAEMENKRDDLVVILAGYSNEIEELLESNPGFKSRISNNFEFQDYSANELVDLLKMNITAQNLILTSEAESKIIQYIFKEKQNNNVDGNGRWVRNVVDKLKKNQANRLAESNEFTEKSIMTIEANDVL
jgi:stage V sporulation protein K